MRQIRTLAAAAALAVAGFSASADGTQETTIAPPERSISSDYILVGLLSVLLIWAAIDAQD